MAELRGRKHLGILGHSVSATLTLVLFIGLRELFLMKGADTESIFSVVCSSDILKQHNSACDIFLGYSLVIGPTCISGLICTNRPDLPE